MILYAPIDSPGALYCVALSERKVPESIGFVKTTGTRTYYATASKQITVTVSGLVALTSYTVYCYAQTSGGFGTSYSDVIGLPKAVRTICCHFISFTNSPDSVYGNSSLYAAGSSASSYLFSYSLDSRPTAGSITVTPIVTYIDSTPASVTATPSSATFFSRLSDSTSTATGSLSGMFYLTASNSLAGDFMLSLAVTGLSQSNFTSPSAVVHIVSAVEPLPAPKFVSCVFGNSGSFMSITFDKPTDQAQMNAMSFNCSLLLEFQYASLATWYVRTLVPIGCVSSCLFIAHD